MLKYSYSINEEITRWVTEVYLKSNPNLDWYIAFTNPTAGPWKKICVKNDTENLLKYIDLTEKRNVLILY